MKKERQNFLKMLFFLCKKAQKNPISFPLLNQLIRSATSVGANYFEANGALSRKDFRNKIAICCKEARETKYWFHLLSESSDDLSKLCQNLWKEAHELALIFS